MGGGSEFINYLYKRMGKVIDWIKESNRWKHLVGGIVIGILSDDWYCATLSGVGIASALEYKDRAWGGTFDWIDWGLTIGGVIVGHAIRWMV